jgi:hypothetical protein
VGWRKMEINKTGKKRRKGKDIGERKYDNKYVNKRG